MNAVNANIDFHNLKNLSSHIHTGLPDASTGSELEALKIAKRELANMLGQASCSTPVRIEWVIRIEAEQEEVEMPEQACLEAEVY